MTISFENVANLLAHETQRLKEAGVNIAGMEHAWLEDNHKMKAIMKRNINEENRTFTHTATVTINPPNEKLTEIISKYFLNEKTQSGKYYYDTVTVNDSTVI